MKTSDWSEETLIITSLTFSCCQNGLSDEVYSFISAEN